MEAGVELADRHNLFAMTVSVPWVLLPLDQGGMEGTSICFKQASDSQHTIPAEARSPGRGDAQVLERESSKVQLLVVQEPKKRLAAAARPRLWARSPWVL